MQLQGCSARFGPTLMSLLGIIGGGTGVKWSCRSALQKKRRPNPAESSSVRPSSERLLSPRGEKVQPIALSQPSEILGTPEHKGY